MSSQIAPSGRFEMAGPAASPRTLGDWQGFQMPDVGRSASGLGQDSATESREHPSDLVDAMPQGSPRISIDQPEVGGSDEMVLHLVFASASVPQQCRPIPSIGTATSLRDVGTHRVRGPAHVRREPDPFVVGERICHVVGRRHEDTRLRPEGEPLELPHPSSVPERGQRRNRTVCLQTSQRSAQDGDLASRVVRSTAISWRRCV